MSETTTEKPVTESQTEWNDWVASVSFISSVLGEQFDTASGTSLHWQQAGVDLTKLDGDKIKITVSFVDGDACQEVARFAIIGYATVHGFEWNTTKPRKGFSPPPFTPLVAIRGAHNGTFAVVTEGQKALAHRPQKEVNRWSEGINVTDTPMRRFHHVHEYDLWIHSLVTHSKPTREGFLRFPT